ncbi:MAG: DUF4118 domain-containing protein [Lachnospiraceae bacterium]|nr:DUF4118 domain-containing protein [Lachnospiraceae bacterium]
MGPPAGGPFLHGGSCVKKKIRAVFAWIKKRLTEEIYQKAYWLHKWEVTWKNTLVTASILGMVTLVALLYHRISAGTVNIVMFYTIALIFIPRFTEGYVPGIVGAMVSVGCVNYLFTYPYFCWDFSREGYPVTFICMLLIAIMVSAVTSYTKKQTQLVSVQEKQLMEAEKEKMRANLLRAVSHDLRTPLTSIIGASSSYLENEVFLSEEKKRNMVQHIGEDANWLLNMVENLLTVTRIRNDSASVNKSLEPVEEVLSEAVRRIKKRIPEMKLKVFMPEEFVMIPMDAMLIEQVLINLMENAWFHGRSERPIEVYTVNRKDMIFFYVRDYGVGIAPDRLESIFDGEAQNGSADPDSSRGMGIGLSICKTIITAHGGGIRAKNHVEGAEISFWLPTEGES